MYNGVDDVDVGGGGDLADCREESGPPSFVMEDDMVGSPLVATVGAALVAGTLRQAPCRGHGAAIAYKAK
ncbi:hypothetical protein Malapachy_4131 [Malassezia pachydermatis]|uniref:Uncharacterized protein n=1 Tax=Malassezia pachydermatis TaxID=77020 RepID=A0A0M8MU57_9BASI|nr:hypothetical protein Malapachy_4131 [Malassezia pachydermatis]KOS14394.1 hypothetical protein Malapachy_4131 [Malassezia pachydermatis]